MSQKIVLAASIILTAALLTPLTVLAQPQSLPQFLPQFLPASTSPQFCVKVQQILASTDLVGDNTVFDDMPSYRHSKPAAKPLTIYQVVTYAAQMPIVVSCKMKTAAHLRANYGEDAAGQQFFCPDVARILQQQAIEELQGEGRTEAAARAARFVIDPDEPFITGQAYLKDFRTIYHAEDGAVHISSPGLYQNHESWYTPLLPEMLKGQSYCHLATVESVKAVATGERAPGTTITTIDDAPTQRH
jgi:hypothetical protein